MSIITTTERNVGTPAHDPFRQADTHQNRCPSCRQEGDRPTGSADFHCRNPACDVRTFREHR